MYHATVNVGLMGENVTWIKSGIIINASAKIKESIMCAKKIIFEILLHQVVKMVNSESIIRNLVFTCDETIKPTKTAPAKSTSKNLNKKKLTCKTKNISFTCLFIDYHSYIDSC